MRREKRRLMIKDHYKTLELSRDADQQQVRASWKRMAFTWHPDRNAHQAQEASRKFVDVAEAYQVLSNLVERARYDRLNPRAGLGPKSSASEPTPARRQGRGASSPRPPRASGPTATAPVSTPTLWAETEAEAEARTPGPSLRAYRAAVKELARDLADADPRGRRLDALRGAFGIALGIACAVAAGPPWWSTAEDATRAPLWVPVFLGLSALVMLVWTWSLRMQRRERLRPYAEEVLERTGRGWRAPRDGRMSDQV